MIGSDESHKRLQSDFARANAQAMGTGALLFLAAQAISQVPLDWYPLDWMDTAHSQQVLSFQHFSWSDSYEEIRAGSAGRRDRCAWRPR